MPLQDFWVDVNERLPRWRTDFRARFGGDLLSDATLPPFVGKGAKRIREKVVLACMQDPDKNLHYFPNDCGAIPRIGDLVRTRVSCRFIEGVEYFADRLLEVATDHKLGATRSREGRLQGYFAQHVEVPYAFTYRTGGANRTVDVKVEIQVATELSTRVWDVTHAIYEDARRGRDDPHEWQWNPRDPRFVSRQLGHMIHLADGLLSQLRDQASAPEQPMDGEPKG